MPVVCSFNRNLFLWAVRRSLMALQVFSWVVYGLCLLTGEFGMRFGHGRLCVCPPDHVQHLGKGGQQKTLRANGPGIYLAQPQRAGYPSTEAHKRANGPAVCADSSMPNVSFVHFNSVPFAEPPVFVLERTRCMMLVRTSNEFVHVVGQHSEHLIAK